MKLTVADSFCAAHRLLRYRGDCHNLHGHTYNVRFSISGAMDASDDANMLLDFRIMKSLLSRILRYLDHKTLLNKDDTLVEILLDASIGVVLLDGDPTVECLGAFLYNRIAHALTADTVRYFWYNQETHNIKIQLKESATSFVTYP